MVSFVEILFGIAAGSAFVGVIAFVQSKSGPERAQRYRERMKGAFTMAAIVLLLATAGELWLRMR